MVNPPTARSESANREAAVTGGWLHSISRVKVSSSAGAASVSLENSLAAVSSRRRWAASACALASVLLYRVHRGRKRRAIYISVRRVILSNATSQGEGEMRHRPLSPDGQYDWEASGARC